MSARNFGVAYGIASDKSEKERLLLDMQERRPAISQAQLDVMVQRLRGCLGDLGMTPSAILPCWPQFVDGSPASRAQAWPPPRLRPLPEPEPDDLADDDGPLVADAEAAAESAR